MARTYPDHSRRVAFEDLDRQLQGMPSPLPQADFARELISSVGCNAQMCGAPLDKAFRGLNKGDNVQVADVRDVLSRQSQLSNQQWTALVPFLGKSVDGQVPWRDLLKWAGLEVSEQPLPKPMGAQATGAAMATG